MTLIHIGFDGASASPHGTTPQRPPAWSKGLNRVLWPGVCCPHCGSIDVTRHDNGRSESTMRWECRDCRQAWKESIQQSFTKAWVSG
jgi:hypothetical protein